MNGKPTGGRMRLLGVGMAVLVLGGLGYATIPTASDVVFACYQQGSGVLRVIDAAGGETCRPNEVAVTLATPSLNACPEGTAPFVGVCIETAPRLPDSHSDATRDCADEGRRLPSGGELQGFREMPGITLASGGKWTDDLGDVTLASAFVYLVVTQTGNGVEEAPQDFAYRCVT